jgi:acyl dehydratase
MRVFDAHATTDRLPGAAFLEALRQRLAEAPAAARLQQSLPLDASAGGASLLLSATGAPGRRLLVKTASRADVGTLRGHALLFDTDGTPLAQFDAAALAAAAAAALAALAAERAAPEGATQPGPLADGDLALAELVAAETIIDAPVRPKALRCYWEDFPVGLVRECGHVRVRRDAILAFAQQFDPQPFHLDDDAAARSLFGELSASGWHTCAMAMRLMCEGYLLESASLGSPGIENLRWLKPVLADDVLFLRMTVLAARPMTSKPGVGLTRNLWEVRNQHGETVLSMEGWGMMRRRTPVPA